MAHVLVTGASGFIGSHLVEALLERGDEVTCLVHAASVNGRSAVSHVRQVHGDVTDPDAMQAAVRNIDTVYHLAGLTRSLTDAAMMRINAEGTRTVSQACADRNSPPTLVLVSSLAAVGPTTNGEPRRETDPCHPVSTYGLSKLDAEQAIVSLAHAVPATIVRPPIVMGLRDPSTRDLFRPIYRFRIHVIPGLCRRRFSIVHVADLANALILAAEQGTRIDADEDPQHRFRTGCYFVADEATPTYGELGAMIATALDRRIVVPVPVPDWTIHVAGRAADVVSRLRKKPNIFSRDKAREATAGSWTCSPKKIRDELGFQPAFPLALRLEQTADRLKESGSLACQ